MKSTGRKYSKHFQQREVRALPADPADAAREMLTKDEIVAYKATRRQQRMRKATNAYCAFNVLEAFVSVVGMGDDINAIIRTCPAPRDGESELACQVNGAGLVTWVANAAAKLSYAATNCALNLNVDAVCSVGGWPTTGHWRGSDWSWSALWSERRHGGRQPRQHGPLH